eukprot:scaffold8901_cov115-Isochrysis_galbana.AAC.5
MISPLAVPDPPIRGGRGELRDARPLPSGHDDCPPGGAQWAGQAGGHPAGAIAGAQLRQRQAARQCGQWQAGHVVDSR